MAPTLNSGGHLRQFAAINQDGEDRTLTENAQTQLAGWVQSNLHLAAGNARVILNEVLAC